MKQYFAIAAALSLMNLSYAQVEPLNKRANEPFIYRPVPVPKDAEKFVAAVLQEGNPFPNGFLCSASVIADGWVLTAAHCMFDSKCRKRGAEELAVAAGMQILHAATPALPVGNVHVREEFACMSAGEQRAAIKQNFPLRMGNDIALLQVPKLRAPQNRPMVAAQQLTAASINITVLGWGTVDGSSGPSDLLQSGALRLTDRQGCVNAWLPSSLTDDLICAGTPLGAAATGVCSGDSGGPLIVPSAAGWLQTGVTSFGHLTCTKVDKPSLFTDVAAHLDWIEKRVGKGVLQSSSTVCTPAAQKVGTC